MINKEKIFHSFAVCAYGKSPYLESCILSVIKNIDENDEYKSEVIICTSTDNEHIRGLASKYGIKMYLNTDGGSIGADWQFAYNCCAGEFVTLVHQDDIYSRHYKKEFIKSYKKNTNQIIYSTSCYIAKEKLPGKFKLYKRDMTDFIKLLLKAHLQIPGFNKIKILKQLSLSFGNPFICPTVTYNKSVIDKFSDGDLFDGKNGFVLDWKALWKLSFIEGAFVFNNKPLICYRVHARATSKEFTDNDDRYREEYDMFFEIWSHNLKNKRLAFFLTNLIMKGYRLSYKRYKEI